MLSQHKITAAEQGGGERWGCSDNTLMVYVYVVHYKVHNLQNKQHSLVLPVERNPAGTIGHHR